MNFYRRIGHAMVTASLAAISFASLASNNQAMTKNAAAQEQPSAKPNVVVIFADDLGIGDVSAYKRGTLHTPGIDELAAQGLLFNRGYATAATCTPSRYSMLTGNYPLRRQGVQVLAGDAPLIIDPKQETLPKMLKRAGYTTAVVGKWHLGLGAGSINWNKHISPGANEIGFDYSYIMGATNDRTPNVYVKNGLVENLDPNDPLEVKYAKTNPFPELPSGSANPELLKVQYTPAQGHDDSINNGISRIGWQRGGKSAMWVDEEMSDLFLKQAKDFVKANKDKPFFLYYALHQPHVPRLPHHRFAGVTGMGPRGDAIIEADWAIKSFNDFLQAEGLDQNTIIVFTSDNGPVLDDGYVDGAVQRLGDHTPGGQLRGGKYSLYDAGAHVPFIVKWPARIKANTTSDAFVSQHDLLASLAAYTGTKVFATDSEDYFAALIGEDKVGRREMLIEGTSNTTALHQDGWVYIPVHKQNRNWGDEVGIDSGLRKAAQLYDLTNDPKQQHNLADKYPEKVKQMQKALDEIKNK